MGTEVVQGLQHKHHIKLLLTPGSKHTTGQRSRGRPVDSSELRRYLLIRKDHDACTRERIPRVFLNIFPQIAIAIGVLTSNRGQGDEPLWRIGRGTRVPLQGAVDVVPLLGAIVGCHSSVLWLRGRVTTNFGGVDVVPLQGAIVVCYGWGKGVVPLQAAIVVCHCSVLWLGGRVMTNFNFGGMDVVPLLGAIAGCHCSVLWCGEGRGGWRPTLAEWTWCHCKVPL